jgi:hypothetical protein
MRKKKEYNLFQKIRAALRDIYRYSPMRREAIKAVTQERAGNKYFRCPLCLNDMYIQMAEVDHEPSLGPLNSWGHDKECGVEMWIWRLFYGPVQVICKICHRKKTAEQRRKKK